MQRLYEKNPGKNPGRVLYNYWFDILSYAPTYKVADDGKISARTTFGEDSWRSLSFHGDNPKKPERPDISYGALFVLRHDGSFRLWSPRGGNQRRAIVKHTFLNFGVYRGYNWTVDLGTECHYWGLNQREFENIDNPIHYVNEHTMGVQGYGGATWSKLVPDDSEAGWRIGFAECLENPTSRVYTGTGYIQAPNPMIRTAADYERFEALRLRRLRLAQVAYGKSVGTHDQQGRVIVSPEERNAEGMLALIAAMDVHTPAKTTPMRREREEGLWALSGFQ